MVIEEEYRDDNGSRVKVYSTDDQDWDDESLKELETKYNVFYTPGCVTPIKITGIGSENPILHFGIQDDGFLTIENSIVFSAYYLDSLIEHLKMVKSKIEKSKNS